jgi:hypothetical protein
MNIEGFEKEEVKSKILIYNISSNIPGLNRKNNE